MTGRMKHVISIAAAGMGAVAFAFVSCAKEGAQRYEEPHAQGYRGTGSVTQGRAETVVENLFTCETRSGRIASVGTIKDVNGQSWTVPAEQQFATGTKATDLYNDCTGVTPENLSQVNIAQVPIVVIDGDGEIITGYIFADNYFELYINGRLIGVDPVPFTPFNSNIVRFKVRRPYEIAVKVIDWEENLGLGTESNRGNAFHAGDGGFIASFSDGTITNASWSAQTFYIAPIYDLGCLTEFDNVRGSTGCSPDHAGAGDEAFAVHWAVPVDWRSPDFDDSGWPNATTYTEDEIGVDNKPAYMNFREKFAGSGAEFIWSSNVVLDNEVLLRYRVH